LDTRDETPPTVEVNPDDAPSDAPPPGWTPEQWATFQQYTRGYGDQDENGIDLSLLRRNLRLTPAQRLERLQQAVNSFPKVRRHAGTRH